MRKLTEDQYELIRPLLPVQRGNVRIANLEVINALLYVAEQGCKWRGLPKRFRQLAHHLHPHESLVSRTGVLDRVFEQPLQREQIE